MADPLPTGIITLMFTDIQNSTVLWEKMGDRFRPVLNRHNELLRELIERWEGYEVKSQGDSFMVAFQRGTDALHCAVEIQRALAEEAWPPEMGELLVRIGLHAGEPFLGYDSAGRADYFGPVVNRAARIAALGYGGQILLSAATRDLVQGALSGDLQWIDLGRHHLRGLEQAEQLFEARHPDLPARHFPPLRSAGALPTNLPVYLTPFVGRQEALQEMRELLARPEVRLLTVTGPGGAGKTRLAHQTASEGAGSFPDGVWLVNLAEVSEPENVAPEIAAALQLALLPHPDPREQLTAFLKERELLLVLDSFERVVGASLLLGEILKAAPRVKCLITSQIALRLRGEHVYTVPPMPAPAARETSPEQLLRCDSVALFVERARAVRPQFALTPENAAAVAELCRRLDGIPLALELAAAQVVEMSVTEMLQGLESRLDLLWSESPDLPERHRTLRAAIDWSYGLLAPVEQHVLEQLSVFGGGCFREAVPAVCGPEGLTALRTLHRHSLAETREGAEGRTRYRLLPMVREYARAKLEQEPGVARGVIERHAEYYLCFAEARAAQMRTHEEARALDEAAEELDNLRAALDGTEPRRDGERCARLTLALHEPLYRRGFWEEARRRLEAAWAAVEGPGDDDAGSDRRRLRARIAHQRASLAQDMGDPAGARRAAEVSLGLWQALRDAPGTAEALNLLGLLAQDEGDMESARRCFDEALRLLDEQDHARRGMVLHNRAFLASRRGDPETAERLYEESLAHQRQAGDRRHEAATLGNRGVLAHEQGDLAAARRFYLEGLTLHQMLDDRHGIAITLNNLGEISELEGDPENAVLLFSHAERMLRELRSAHRAIPAASLQRLEKTLDAGRWSAVRSAAERSAWQEVVERSPVERRS